MSMHASTVAASTSSVCVMEQKTVHLAMMNGAAVSKNYSIKELSGYCCLFFFNCFWNIENATTNNFLIVRDGMKIIVIVIMCFY